MNSHFPADIEALLANAEKALQDAWQYYRDDARLLAHLHWLGFQPRTIYDVGASNTVWSVTAFQIFPNANFELFEPLAEISEDYRQGKAHPAVQNFLEKASYRVHPVALGAENKMSRFSRFYQESGSTSLELDWKSDSYQVIDVPMRRMENLVREAKLPPPDLIKMDTQGAELDILRGAGDLLREASVLFIECWLQKSYGKGTPLLRTLANYLNDYGFVLFDIGDQYRDENDIPVTRDAVFVRTDLPLQPR